ncbi:hypothetical protein C2G38_2197790 [Gigaspora rosea]|uniref:Uncharacterized protein n=1 Tax=Gigaspora rosea TaxID=44941 RepID=A0A397UTI6_9GLOM|nr:hypothetical protein C2G38_2197790 [Gigaspora rosea]
MTDKERFGPVTLLSKKNNDSDLENAADIYSFVIIITEVSIRRPYFNIEIGSGIGIVKIIAGYFRGSNGKGQNGKEWEKNAKNGEVKTKNNVSSPVASSIDVASNPFD